MGGDGIAAHTLNGDKNSALKPGKTYAYDTMNLLYSMCFNSAIAELLNQRPPVPTREIVGLFDYLRSFLNVDSPFFLNTYLPSLLSPTYLSL